MLDKDINQPFSWPYLREYKPLEREDAIFFMVDMQEALCPAIQDAQEQVAAAGVLIEGAKILSCPLIVSEQYPKGLGKTLPELASKISSGVAAELFSKTDFDATAVPGLIEALSRAGRKSVILFGWETHICIWQTCVSLLREGYGVYLPADALGSRKNENKERALAHLALCGASVCCSETLLFEMLKKAGTPEFKAIAKLIK